MSAALVGEISPDYTTEHLWRLAVLARLQSEVKDRFTGFGRSPPAGMLGDRRQLVRRKPMTKQVFLFIVPDWTLKTQREAIDIYECLTPPQSEGFSDYRSQGENRQAADGEDERFFFDLNTK